LKKEKLQSVWKLFCSYFKIGAFTFGGGYAMLAIVENEVVSKKKWLTHDEMMDIIVVAESTPGPVAINTATFVGYKIGGFLGSFCATFGVVLPSFVIIYIISMFLKNFFEITWVASAFQGIKAAVAFLIFSAGWKMFRKTERKLLNMIVFAAALAVMLMVNLGLLRLSAIYLILTSAVVGLVLYGIRIAGKGGKKK